MTVIWAKGADSKDYVHMIPSGEDKELTFFQPGVFRLSFFYLVTTYFHLFYLSKSQSSHFFRKHKQFKQFHIKELSFAINEESIFRYHGKNKRGVMTINLLDGKRSLTFFEKTKFQTTQYLKERPFTECKWELLHVRVGSLCLRDAREVNAPTSWSGARMVKLRGSLLW